jgi:hypothetical protein
MNGGEAKSMGTVSIAIPHLPHSLDSLVEDMFQLKPMNRAQKDVNAFRKIRWTSEQFPCPEAVPVAEKPNV